jgi:hypothetical protein
MMPITANAVATSANKVSMLMALIPLLISSTIDRIADLFPLACRQTPHPEGASLYPGLSFNVELLVRRAKLGSVSWGEVPAAEALARRRVLRVASSKVTTAAKRIQGGDGPQCVGVKG